MDQQQEETQQEEQPTTTASTDNQEQDDEQVADMNSSIADNLQIDNQDDSRQSSEQLINQSDDQPSVDAVDEEEEDDQQYELDVGIEEQTKQSENASLQEQSEEAIDESNQQDAYQIEESNLQETESNKQETESQPGDSRAFMKSINTRSKFDLRFEVDENTVDAPALPQNLVAKMLQTPTDSTTEINLPVNDQSQLFFAQEEQTTDYTSIPSSIPQLQALIRTKSITQIKREEEEHRLAEEQRKEQERIQREKELSIQRELDRKNHPQLDREAMLVKMKGLLERRDRAKSKNVNLQLKLAEYFKKKRPDDRGDTEKSTADFEDRYASSLNAFKEYKVQLQAIAVANTEEMNILKQELEKKREEGLFMSKEFSKLKKQAFHNAEFVRSGKAVPAKEEFGDGLHLIDFEQLKIENQAYNEKIEERNEELLKLRKKITNIVQILTHVKEKLHYYQRANESLRKEMKEIDKIVAEKRDALPNLKVKRDAIRANNVLLRQRNGLLGNYDLLRDFENKKDACATLNSQLQNLQNEESNLVQNHNEVKRQIQKIQLRQRLENFDSIKV